MRTPLLVGRWMISITGSHTNLFGHRLSDRRPEHLFRPSFFIQPVLFMFHRRLFQSCFISYKQQSTGRIRIIKSEVINEKSDQVKCKIIR